MNVIGAVELLRRRADLGVPPAEVSDAPAHHEVDVLAAAGVGEVAVGGVADHHVLGFALAAEVLLVELAEVHRGSSRTGARARFQPPHRHYEPEPPRDSCVRRTDPQSGYSSEPCTHMNDWRSIMSRGRRP